jgi:glucose/arabinose dehydrogenase
LIKNREIVFIILSISIANILINFDGIFISAANGQFSEKKTEEGSSITHDPKLKAELVVSGLDFPTSMAFIDQNDFLILEKKTGLVKRVIDGNMMEPLLKLDVSGKDERGLLGIDIHKKEYTGFDVLYVYLSYVECRSKETCENKVVRYELDKENNRLLFPKQILAVNSFPDDSHVGGVVKVGPDDNVYVTLGDFSCTTCAQFETQAQNFENGVSPDGRAGILRISPDGDPVGNGILGEEYPLNLYFAYGIRNSFGIDFDPLTGYLWDTENGPDYGDEINLVEPGFNSGALKIFGKFQDYSDYEFDNIVNSNTEGAEDLVTFNGIGRYSDPELSWQHTVAPTAVLFFDSNKLGNYYQNDLFVANAGEGKIYHFDLSQDRKLLELKDPLDDKVVDSEIEEDSITFAEGFGMITDLEVNPYDGYLYVVAPVREDSTGGSVYKIVPKYPGTINVPSSPRDAKGPTSSSSSPTNNTIQFPSGIESTEEGIPQVIEDKEANNNNNNNLVMCNKLTSLGKVLIAEWQLGKITTEQTLYLGQQIKELMIQEECIN